MNVTRISDVSHLSHLFLKSHLEIQTMFYIFMLLKNKIKKLLKRVSSSTFGHLENLLTHTNDVSLKIKELKSLD